MQVYENRNEEPQHQRMVHEASHGDTTAEGEHGTEQVCIQNREVSDISYFLDVERIQLSFP